MDCMYSLLVTMDSVHYTTAVNVAAEGSKLLTRNSMEEEEHVSADFDSPE